MLIPESDTYSSFDTTLLCPKKLADVSLNGYATQVLLEPDGQKSHWFKVDAAWLETANCQFDQQVQIELDITQPEPEPEVPQDLNQALHNAPDALKTWQATTTIARLD